jgi:hypothetical protein
METSACSQPGSLPARFWGLEDRSKRSRCLDNTSVVGDCTNLLRVRYVILPSWFSVIVCLVNYGVSVSRVVS